MRRFTIILLTLAVVLAIGCTRTRPPEITVGTTTCAACGNVINDLTLASVARSKTDKSEKAFDGARCLLRTIPDGDEWQVWFHAAKGEGWIDAKKAAFVLERRDRVIRSVLAYPSVKSARKVAKKQEEVRNGWDEIADSYGAMRYAVEKFGDHGPGGM